MSAHTATTEARHDLDSCLNRRVSATAPACLQAVDPAAACRLPGRQTMRIVLRSTCSCCLDVGLACL